jgi:hypothetical protein
MYQPSPARFRFPRLEFGLHSLTTQPGVKRVGSKSNFFEIILGLGGKFPMRNKMSEKIEWLTGICTRLCLRTEASWRITTPSADCGRPAL